jgi:hypothetical protein
VDSQVEAYTDPSGPGANPAYRQRQDYGLSDNVPLIVGGQTVAQISVTGLLPP